MIRILIADDQTLMRDGLKTILELEDDMEVAGVCENGSRAFELCGELHPDVVLMDIRMPIMNGVESVKLIKKDYPEIAVIMLTTFDDEEYIVDALSNGACGYLLKDMSGDRLIDAIRDAVKGNLLIPSVIAAKLAARLARNTSQPQSNQLKTDLDLSERELEIASLLAKGYSNRQISSELYITEGTVKNYISSIYSKIDISDRTKAVLFLKSRLNVQ